MWLIKSKNLKITGPFSEEEICFKIQSSEFNADEMISQHPFENWVHISSYPRFYEELLKYLSQDDLDKKTELSRSFEKISLKEKIIISTDKIKLKDSNQKKGFKKNLSHKRKNKKSVQKPSFIQSQHEKITIRRREKNPLIIEMGNIQKEKSRNFIKKIALPLLVSAALFGFVFKLFNYSHTPPHLEGAIQFLIPRDNKPSISQKETKEIIIKGLQFFIQDQSSSYLKAQSEFVRAIEGNPSNVLALSYLCLTYFELWPYSSRSSEEIKAIGIVNKKIEKLNQGGAYSALCRSAQLLIKEKYLESYSFIKTSISELDQNKQSENISPFFYYLKSVIQAQELKYDQALLSLKQTNTLFPQWIRPYVLEGKLLKKNNQIGASFKAYTKVVQMNASHKSAVLNQGVLTVQFLKDYKKGEAIIQGALKWPEIVPAEDLSEAYFTLFKISKINNDVKKAKEYGQKSLMLKPDNQELQEYLSKFQEKTTSDKGVKSRLLVERGDQLVREGQPLKARDYYKMAFRADKGKNAIAATKLGENLWNFGLSNEAISWLKKAITVNPNYIRAYILLSDYYLETYEFKKALKNLKTANKRFPESLDVIKGYANLSLKKNNFESAVYYAQKALNLYESDVESYIILSKAYANNGKKDESLQAAKRGLEINRNDRNAQLQYATSLGEIYGVDVAFDYFNQLLSNTELGSQTHVEYILGLAQFLYKNLKYNQALNVLKILVDVKEKPSRYFILQGKIYSMNKSTIPQAYEAFINAASLDPKDPKIMFHIGQILMRSNEYVKARKNFQKILSFYPRYPQIHYYIAQTYFKEGGRQNLILGLKETEIESRLNPFVPETYQLSGEIYYTLGKYTLCAQSFQKAIELVPDDSELYLRVAECYRKSGYLDLALKMLKSISKQKDKLVGNPKVYRELGALYEMKKEYDNATISYSIYLNLLPHAKDKEAIQNRVKQFGQ